MTDRHRTDGAPEPDDAERGGGAPPRRTRAEERIESTKTPSRSELMERIDGLERDLAEARERAEEHLRSWQRAAADLSNFRRRTEDERGTVSQFAAALLIGKLLTVLDDFDRALENVPADAHESWVDGVRLVERKLRNVLESEGVTPIEALGRQFDPNHHEAVVHEETNEHPDNEVIGELQRGYRLHDRVLRPALVKVANNPRQH
jgi:molecular chaperone GrpE